MEAMTYPKVKEESAIFCAVLRNKPRKSPLLYRGLRYVTILKVRMYIHITYVEHEPSVCALKHVVSMVSE